MTDNASEMICENESLSKRIKGQNNKIFSNTCICHRLNLVRANLLKYADQTESLQEFDTILAFLNRISSHFSYSYKRESDL